ncbi:MAG: urease accessory protein UreD [Actinomycetes bacterium]|jgi:urease accessory protein|nr:urease accessory protein UreD [Actinomycetes bacterium]
MTSNRFSQPSELSLKIGAVRGSADEGADGRIRSVVEALHFTAPFKVTKPFYDAADRLRVMVLAVSAGIMAGDEQTIEVVVDEEAQAEIISQSFEKVHKMGKGEYATRETCLVVESGARLEYVPLPVIPFAASDFRQHTEVKLADDSAQLFFSDIVSAGRLHFGESFDFTRYRARTRVSVGDDLLYGDNMILEPAVIKDAGINLSGFCLFEGYTHQGSILLVGPQVNDELEDAIVRIIAASEAAEDLTGGVSRASDFSLCVRVLAHGSEPLLNLRNAILELDRGIGG